MSTRVPTLCTRVPPILLAGRDGRLSLVTARTTREETEGYDSAAAIKVCESAQPWTLSWWWST